MTDSPQLPADCWFLTGPTASGKTTVGLELAGLLNAEIISLDSMAIYREMDIGTAKPTPDQQLAVPHHLIDIVAPTEDFSLADYVDAAHQQVAEIQGRGKGVLFVGGTPLYLKALLRGLYSGPPPDWEFRKQVAAEVEQVGEAALHARLAQVDPLSAAKLHPSDQRRIIRALEVYKTTGEPLSHRQTQFDDGRPAEACRVFVLHWPRELLHERINNRVQRMFDTGLIDEVRGLLARHGSLSRTASQAVGYREAIDHLTAGGGADLATTVESVKTRTRQFAKRQQTWFRGLSECRFVERGADDATAQVAKQIAESA